MKKLLSNTYYFYFKCIDLKYISVQKYISRQTKNNQNNNNNIIIRKVSRYTLNAKINVLSLYILEIFNIL